MGKIPKQIQGLIEDYVKKISNQIPIKKAFLFGSYSKGTYNEESDIDIAIFSDYFNSMNRADGIYFLLLQAMDYGVDIQPQAFTMKDYEEQLGIVEEIIETGIELPIN